MIENRQPHYVKEIYYAVHQKEPTNPAIIRVAENDPASREKIEQNAQHRSQKRSPCKMHADIQEKRIGAVAECRVQQAHQNEPRELLSFAL